MSVSGKIVVLIVCVDDIVLSGDDTVEIIRLKKKMTNEFVIKDLGNLKYFLEMEVARSREGISISQRKYTLDRLKEMSMIGCRPADSPVEFNAKLGDLLTKFLLIKTGILRGTYGSCESDSEIFENDSRKSTSGYCTFVWGNLVTWRSTKQGGVARSSVEAEYKAMSLGICEEIWLKKVLYDLHQDSDLPMKFYCDNKAAVSIANNPV
ncbi:uncharacterized mitochondrial protein AtMg00810-like [Benincasa hispida]|uniref:uncharacterized mitochondrial protein AtMg00810-like n=1 Tax=Benincasa hispida TaxID=102211 RepID=UPI0018FFBBC4|nr:uncharacterized mitochondrial protein AtMg00810-like [Benincasa hispida]